MVDGCCLLSLVLILMDKEGEHVLMQTTTTTTHTCPITIQGVHYYHLFSVGHTNPQSPKLIFSMI